MSNVCFVEVVLDEQKTKPLDYKVPVALADLVKVGMRVAVPFRSQMKKGTIVLIKNQSAFPGAKEIGELLSSTKTIDGNLWKLAVWMAEYYIAPIQKVLRCFTPPNVRKEVKPKVMFRYNLAVSRQEAVDWIVRMRQKSPKQAEALEAVLQAEKGVPSSDAISALVKKKLVQKVEVPIFSLEEDEFFQTKPKELNREQTECLDSIIKTVDAKRFGAHLIQGVTGSGKTEIYLQAIQKTLSRGKKAIMLVPEISLTSQTIERFRSRFPNKIAIWHHKRSLQERAKAWEAMSVGDADIVIGARSAIFCPIQQLGLIIVDEEHDNSYKQTLETPCYNGRDVAVMRGYIEQCAVILASATPSLESRRNADIGKYALSKLLTRATNSSIPNVTIVDMQTAWDRNGGFTHFSHELASAMKQRIELGEQTLLFLNRRGYHRLQICASCKEVVKCPHCDLGLAYHKADHFLCCHTCDFKTAVPNQCPSCKSRESLQFKGFGTEHVERSLKALFPTIRTLRMDRDTTKQKISHESIYQAFKAHKADVLIGTQMIAKGLHFPAVTLVGILNADPGLHIPDFRSAEQMFQLITQVSGRAGRSDLAGEVILQTFMPDHPIIQLAKTQDFDKFYEREIEERKKFHFPPFCHLIKLTFSGKDAALVEQNALKHYEALKKLAIPNTSTFPPSPAGHPKIKNLYRFHVLIRCQKISDISPYLKQYALSKDMVIDIDPISIFF